MTSQSGHRSRHALLLEIVESTLDAIKHGSFILNEVSHDLNASVELSKQQTAYYAPDSDLSTWSSNSSAETLSTSTIPTPTEISILQMSTLKGARLIAARNQSKTSDQSRIGVLNFASAKNPGGGFLRGAQAQEESLARSSTLYPSLMTSTAQQFYISHKRDPRDGYYSHGMIYCPNVLLFRDDLGNWEEPLDVDILVSPAVNAGLVRRKLREVGREDEGAIEPEMRERMARVLFLFERRGVKDIVLGSFGTGVFRNKVDLVATIWADLLVADGARFKDAFNRIIFAILDKKTFDVFKNAFEERAKANRSS